MAVVWEKLVVMALRLYLAGRMYIEADGALIGERDFPGRQGRIAFAYLASRRRVAVPREELAEIVWPTAQPRSWETALSAIISNLRALLGRAGHTRPELISAVSGCYRMQLPADTWIDCEAAVDGIDRAEGALRAGDPAAAYGWAGIAACIARRTFLPGESGAWAEQQRAVLQNVLLRALECYAAIFLWNREYQLAARMVEEALRLEPYREHSYQQLMRILAGSGNRAEAVRVYQRCRRLLSEELGIEPAPQTEAAYLEILQLS